MSPALAGRFLTTGLKGKSLNYSFLNSEFYIHESQLNFKTESKALICILMVESQSPVL